MNKIEQSLRLGVDVGSTTVKLVVIRQGTDEVLFSRYQRHGARQTATAAALLEEAAAQFPGTLFRIGVCGSGGRPVAKALGAHYIQEVVANAAAVRASYPQVRTAVELGGQDAKVVFFRYDETAGRLTTSDMRMNGSCAGGTGAFIDEIAALLDVPAEGFEALAAQGTTVYDISGRCGVFAKTDIQPLLIGGAARADIALSAFHAIAKQTIGGLSQGLELTPPIIFEGGPLTFDPTLVRVFAQRLGLTEEEIVLPEHPETIVALGTALAVDELFPGEEDDAITLAEAARRLRKAPPAETASQSPPYFATELEQASFERRHRRELLPLADVGERKVLRGYLGIDSGSTTSKCVLIDEDERVVDTFYANNRGEPLYVVRDGLTAMAKRFRDRGVRLEILGLGTTGYGEQMLSAALRADYHTVETVAHAQGCRKFIPDATFLLDIGGQDMKAIWLKDGVVTNIMLNEACSSGCGSFLENFAVSLGIPVEEIAAAAFHSKSPAHLGSRCTVFMNSTIINEQRNGKQTEDIMAGLCRSIIENVFTKVVRIANTGELGDRIVVQGGTFRNFAVLRALEEYLGKEVVLAPYPGEMGALGAALSAKHAIERDGYANGRCSSFIGFDAVERFTCQRESGVRCTLCANHCSRTIMTFSTGDRFVTGNRCDRGAIVAPDRETLAKEAKAAAEKAAAVPDLYKLRRELLMRDYPCAQAPDRGEVIGIPRVLEFWDSMPFWTTFFRGLGYTVRLSRPSGREQYEAGLQYVASDTVCFPAKLVHGHIRDLVRQGVDRIFFPYIMHMPTENKGEKSPYVCPVVMGYPMVVRNFQSPERRFDGRFDTPVFHWFSQRDRREQICRYAVETLGVGQKAASAAFDRAAEAIESFRRTLRETGAAVIEQAEREGKFAVVLAGRPYHNDPFICHGLSEMFTRRGIPVVTVDSLPGLHEADLHRSRVEITNDFHARMLSGAMVAAAEPALEYVQIVSFGCGHDAILSDEIIRMMNEGAGKPPLILKLDESDAAGSLGIRVQSFVETVRLRRALPREAQPQPRPLPDPYIAKFKKADRTLRTVLVPNISAPVSTLLSALMRKEGLLAQALPVGGPEEIRLGKKYTHNDICFPCQMVIGEIIRALQEGNYPKGTVAAGMAKLQCDCRMANYSALLRKALDSAGFSDVPILSTDPGDTKGMHPGVSMLGARSVIEAAWVFSMLDILEELLRKTRPYERIAGETDRVFTACVDRIAQAVEGGGVSRAISAFRGAVRDMAAVEYDRSEPKPLALVTGELLVTYHPGTNFHIEEYLERNGMETVLPRITYQFRKDFLASICEIREFKAHIARYPYALNAAMAAIQNRLERIALAHPLYEKAVDPQAMYEEVRAIIPQTLTCGEGWLMAAEIVHYARRGARSFIILQPFGCLPNHVCGRGITKRIKEEFPAVQILPLDLDPDTSYANVENRLQMLIMNGRQAAPEPPAPEGEGENREDFIAV